jgi:hypothetical protein
VTKNTNYKYILCVLCSLENLKEGDHAHLECRVEPINDPNLKIDWFVNGIALKTGHRFRTTHDFGYVALDILYTYPDDSGTYMAKATNLLGEAVNTCQITVGGKKLSLACYVYIYLVQNTFVVFFMLLN